MKNYIPFSQRNNYIQQNVFVIKEDLPENVLNSIHNAFTELWVKYNISYTVFDEMKAHFGRYYLDLRIQNNQHKKINPCDYIDSENLDWFIKIDVIEWMFKYLYDNLTEEEIYKLDKCISSLNKEFDRHNYGYRIIKGLFIETTSCEELQSIEYTLSIADNNIVTHLQQAISSISPSNQKPDYRNSIKESISAVGSFLRKQFGGNTMGNALNNMERKHPNFLHKFIIRAIENLYTYTNQEETGIRHELLSQACIPDHSDAMFMIVQASSIINYINNKLSIQRQHNY